MSRIEAYLVAVPLRGAFKNAHAVKTVQRSVVVRVKTDAGLEGAGNVDPSPGYSEVTPETIVAAIESRLAPVLEGVDPANVRSAIARMERAAPGALDAQAAIEMALVDLSGKALGIPAHRLLGGAVRNVIHLNGWIGIVDPESASAAALDFLARGYRSTKIKVGAGVEQDRDRVAAVRAAVPDMEIRVDANEGYDVDSAIRLARALAPYRVRLFEQPVPRHDLAALAKVRRSIDIPVMADEAIAGLDTLAQVIRLEAADLVKVKVMKQGGLFRCLQAVDMAVGAGMQCVIGHGFGLTLNTLAELHVAALSESILEACESVGPAKVDGDVVAAPLRFERGSVLLPDAPGLGAVLDEAALARFRIHAG
ncbi:MAG TPA: enolase C-terminal domain-like protein [Candidatus Methylomirabilis sp.]|nr:enolase C-terminal domain-like protein [Candidatus Methylomirabilis sp.]